MTREFTQTTWDDELEEHLDGLLRLAVREDLGLAGDLTTLALVPEDQPGGAHMVARNTGVVAGLAAAEAALRLVDSHLRWLPERQDGDLVAPGDRVARIEGPARSVLAAERLVLNLVGRLSGVATLTHRFVEAVAGTAARIYDTRKTTPGWRRLEKYAVRCGGGRNHRTGLFDAVLIKDNHLALGAGGRADAPVGYTPAEAIARARRFIERRASQAEPSQVVVEIEVDTLEQLDEVLTAGPDLVLLDNFSLAELREAVGRRNARAPSVELEASGGVTLETAGPIAQTGVDRISVGALTHSAACFDFGLDWPAGDA
ncbi:MAG: carboxylating nicotinate-nucleotide diphosphorylase [Planctomycetota bacterium]